MHTGLVVADAANLFDVSFRSDARIDIGCNMHARRYFVKALEANDARAAIPLAAFRAVRRRGCHAHCRSGAASRGTAAPVETRV